MADAPVLPLRILPIHEGDLGAFDWQADPAMGVSDFRLIELEDGTWRIQASCTYEYDIPLEPLSPEGRALIERAEKRREGR